MPGPRLAHTSLQQEGGKSSFADKTEHSASSAAAQLVIPVSVPLALSFSGAGRGERQCMRQDAAAQRPLPLPAAVLLESCPAAHMRYSKQCWHRMAKRELTFGPAPGFPAPSRRDLAQSSSRQRGTARGSQGSGSGS